ncbi:MAG: GNAT family N-acetyltransferase [Clostridia bacterium]|nr:GNAT family N-acetyltransferase [Clostridia bacterium]
MKFEILSASNVEHYITYLKKAMALDSDLMWAEQVDEAGIRARLNDPFYQNTPSILAFDGDQVVGRIEYHFYGCLQDGYRMAYVDWVYVLLEYRHKGIAQQLFKEFEKDCRRNRIDQYYLIRATNPNADRFYHSFENAELDDEPILRKTVKE